MLKRFVLICLIMLIGLPGLGAASVIGQDVPDWNNLEVLHRNRLPARAFAFPFESKEDAAANAGPRGYLNSSRVELLNGEWDFAWYATPGEVPARFWEHDAPHTIPVPSNVEMHGHGFPNYTNVKYHFQPVTPPLVPEDQNWVSCYWRAFDAPADWAGDRHVLRFEGAGSAIEVYVNGEYVGYSEDGRSSIEFDVTDHVQQGENTLAVKVYRLSNGSYLEDQDFWRLSGLYRDVLIWSPPAVHIDDFGLRTEITDDGGARVDLNLDIAVPSAADVPGSGAVRLELELTDDSGNVVASHANNRVPVVAGQTTALREALAFDNARLWSAEEPNLYTLTMTLIDEGRVIESVPQRVGVREVSIENAALLVNGDRVLIRGVNRHEHEPDTAHAVTYEGMVRDIELMKRNNFNAVRTSHYPNHPVWYQLCDELGLYVTDEANVESHGIGYKPKETLANKPEWTAAHFDRFERMVRRDRNFPSIIAWSLGNEMGDGVAVTAAYRWGKMFDPTRPVQSERAEWADGNTDMVVPMYATPERIERYVKEEDYGKPLVLCEYSHAMGNSNGNFDWYWDRFKEYDELGGGYIWDWVDQGLTAPMPGGSGDTLFGYGGFFEPAGTYNDDNFCMNGVVNADRTLKPAMAAIKHAQQPIAAEMLDSTGSRFRVTSWYNHVDAGDLLVGSWSITEDGIDIASGSMPVPSLAPRASTMVELDIPEFTKQPGAAYFVTLSWHTKRASATVPADHQIAWEQFELPSLGSPPAPGGGTLTFDRDGRSYVFDLNGRVTARIDGYTGLLTALAPKTGDDLLDGPLEPFFWRAPVDNDWGNKMPNRLAAWRHAGKTWKLESIDEVNSEAGLVVRARGKLAGVEASYELVYTFRPSGEVHVIASMGQPKAGVGVMPRFGLRTKLAEELDTLTWFGPGPEESYWDRDEFPVGRWTRSIASQMFPYSEPQESGNHVSTRWAYLSSAGGNGEGHGGLLVVADPANCSVPEQALSLAAVPFDAIEAEPAKYHYQLKDTGPYLHLDTAQTGVGGDNSWGARPKAVYRVKPEAHRVAFTLRPVKDLAEVERRIRLAP